MPTPASPDAVRIVLFGMPAAGKSSLLGALGQSAETQEHLLHGHLADQTHGLAELRTRLYDEQPRRTVEEIVPYPVAFEPFAPEGDGKKVEGILFDCDGRVANDLLMRRKSLDPASPEGTLARAVAEADGLILVIDASAPTAQIDADFGEFGRFLSVLEKGRGQRAEIGGFPVFLVLTKCDLLAKPNESTLDWMEHVEDRKRQVDTRFKDFLSRKAAEEGPLPFGQIDLHLWATAVKRPALADTPAKPREPYGVAELFRQALTSARDFRGRRRHSSNRLLWTVAGAIGVVLLLLAGAVSFAFHGKSPGTVPELHAKIEHLRSDLEGKTPSQRLKGGTRELDREIAVLTEIKNNPSFAQLPLDLRDFAEGRLKELQEYEDYQRRVRAVRPAEAANLRELDAAEKALKELAPPHEDWAQTETARFRDDRLEEARVMKESVKEAEDWYSGLREDGEALRTFRRRAADPKAKAIDWRSWQGESSELLSRADKPSFNKDKLLRGAGSPTWGESVLRFPSVVEAQSAWDATRQGLNRLLDLSAALGLGLMVDRPPLLVFTSGTLTAEECARRLEQLKQTYPEYEKTFRLTDLPEAAVPDIQQAAQGNYDNPGQKTGLRRTGQEFVLRRLEKTPGEGETSQRWAEVRTWLQSGPEELRDWRVLARVLRRLAEPNVKDSDPVTELATFLGEDHFDIHFRRLTLKIPRDLGVHPSGPVVVHQENSEFKLEQAGESSYDVQSRLTTFTFGPADAVSFTFRPGDQVWASLPLKKDGDDHKWAFNWVRGRSSLYQFEALGLGAYLAADGQPATAKYYEDITLTENGKPPVPRLPDLLPVVNLKK